MRTITAAEVPGFFAPGQKVYVGASSNEPVALLDALAAAPGCAAEIEFVHFPLAQLNTRDLTALDPRARVRTFFMAPQYAGKERVEFVPVAYDHERLASEMRAERLPEEFVETVLTGWWTTCLEVLPAKERRHGKF